MSKTPPTVLKIPRKFIDQDRKMLQQCFKHLGYEVRWNSRRIYFDVREKGGKWERLKDNFAAAIRQETSEWCLIEKPNSNDLRPVKMGLERWWDALSGMVGKNEIDPFKEWLESLPPWDAEPRLDKVIEECFAVGDIPPELLRLAASIPIRTAVRRAFHPGWKADIMIVLFGPQGHGKSTFWKELLPDSTWFSDDLDLAAPSKERIEQISGKVFVESAELRE